MRALVRAAVTAALVTAVLPVGGVGRAQPRPLTSADLPRLTHELAQVTSRVERLAAQLDQATARDGGLRVAFDRAQQSRAEAQQVLGVRARQVYMAAGSVPLGSWMDRMADPDLQNLVHAGQRAALEVDQQLVDDVTARSRELAALQRQADAFRRRLQPQVDALLAQQDKARDLLAKAEAIAAAERQASVLAQLEAQRATLDGISTHVAFVLTPGQASRAARALAREEPVVRLLEASGAPYDPERSTCANKELPLGTVIRVSRAGLAVSCLVNDRGPYVDGRVLDMSRAGSRALGYSGVATVTIEVLAPL
jgi:hypothetical protein